MNLRNFHILKLYLSQLSHINCWLLITSRHLNLMLHQLHCLFWLAKSTAGNENLFSVQIVLQTSPRLSLATIVFVAIDFSSILVDLILRSMLIVYIRSTHVLQMQDDLPPLLHIPKYTVLLNFVISQHLLLLLLPCFLFPNCNVLYIWWSQVMVLPI